MLFSIREQLREYKIQCSEPQCDAWYAEYKFYIPSNAFCDSKTTEETQLDAHYAEEAAREEAEERERFEKSGMSVIDYVRSRAEEGEPPFDIDWEIARELAHDAAEGRFAARRLIDGHETAVSEGYPLSIRDARDPEKVLKVLSPIVGKSAAQLGEMKLTRINAESMEHSLNSKEAMHDRKDSSRKGKRLWRGRIGGLSVLDDLIATSPLGKQEAPNHFRLEEGGEVLPGRHALCS